jgi:Ni/Co efflux regulator RcnB
MTSTPSFVLTAGLALSLLQGLPQQALAKKPDDERLNQAEKRGQPAHDRQQQPQRNRSPDRQSPDRPGPEHRSPPSPTVQIALGAYFQNSQIEAARSYYDRPENKGFCPPGLAKKGNGCLPPGQAKKWRKGAPLPAGVIYYDVPRSLVLTLGVPPSGYKYVRVASDILLIAIGTSMVIDAMEDLVR